MTTTLNSAGVSNPPLTLGSLSTDSIELRSELIARLASRMNEMPFEVVRQLLSPHVSRLPSGTSDCLIPLVRELVVAASANEPVEASLSEDRELAISTGLTVSLRWIHSQEPKLGSPLALRIILKSLMPLYLAAGQGRVGTSFVETFSLIRVNCMLPELDRLTNENELAQWLGQPARANSDPIESIPKAFRVSLPCMANVFWREIAAKNNSNGGQTKKLVDANTLTEAKHKAWWSLAGQLGNRRAQIKVPADLSVGVIAWERLLDHWQRVAAVLSSHDSDESPKNSAVMEISHKTDGEIEPRKRTSIASRGEAQIAKKKQNAVQQEKDPKLAEDHRFIEIRSARDPQLSSNLDQILQQSRNDQGILSLMVVKKLGGEAATDAHALQNWQSTLIEFMDSHGEASNVRGFVSDDGELTLVFQDVDRAELAQWIRESFAQFNTSGGGSLATPSAQPLVAGVAMVNAPSRSFKIDQLIQAAWRCLEGASTQGSGAIKTIEVY